MSEWVSEVAQSCLSLCDPMDYSLPGFSVHGISQARILEWVAISFSRGSSQPRDRIQVSCIAGRCFTLWATMEAKYRIHTLSKRKDTHIKSHAKKKNLDLNMWSKTKHLIRIANQNFSKLRQSASWKLLKEIK